MSAPESPTRVNRYAIRADSAAILTSHAVAMTAPAPATVPLSAATTGCRHRRIAADQVAGHPREVEQPLEVAFEERPDDVLHVPARAEPAPRPRDRDRAHLRLAVERAEGVPELVVDLEGKRVQPLGPVERDPHHGGLRVEVEQERTGGVEGEGFKCAHGCSFRCGRRQWRSGPPGRACGMTAVASTSTTARGSTSSVTATSAIAGKCFPNTALYAVPDLGRAIPGRLPCP